MSKMRYLTRVGIVVGARSVTGPCFASAKGKAAFAFSAWVLGNSERVGRRNMRAEFFVGCPLWEEISLILHVNIYCREKVRGTRHVLQINEEPGLTQRDRPGDPVAMGTDISFQPTRVVLGKRNFRIKYVIETHFSSSLRKWSKIYCWLPRIQEMAAADNQWVGSFFFSIEPFKFSLSQYSGNQRVGLWFFLRTGQQSDYVACHWNWKARKIVEK